MKNCNAWPVSDKSDRRYVELEELSIQEDALIKKFNEIKSELKKDFERECSTLLIERVYESTVSVKHVDKRFEHISIIDGTEMVRFASRLTEESMRSHQDLEDKYSGHLIQSDWKKSHSSVIYYRFGNTLLHAGGGYCMFKTPMIMSDEEWEDFKVCKFKPEWFQE